MRPSNLILVSLLAVVLPAFAGGDQSGQVNQVIVRASDGLVYFYMTGTASGKPACAKNPYWIIKDENSTTGKQQLATLLAARASGQTVHVTGLGTCVRWSDGEDVDGVAL